MRGFRGREGGWAHNDGNDGCEEISHLACRMSGWWWRLGCFERDEEEEDDHCGDGGRDILMILRCLF